MSKQKERERRRKQQKSQSRWLFGAGVALVVIAGLWLVFSNRLSNPQAQPISRLSTADFHSLAFSITEPETVFFGHHGGLLVSHNGGKDWESTALNNADAMALALPLSNPAIMYAAGHAVFFKSNDGGETWNPVSTNLPGTDIHGFAVEPDNAEHVFAHVVGFGFFSSQDGGVTWTLLSNAIPSSTFNLVVGEAANTLFAAAGEDGLLQSLDGGQTWNRVSNIPDAGAIAVVYSPASGRLYVSTLGDNAGLYVSDDDGQTWTFTGLNGIILAVAVSPLDPNHLIVVNDAGQVFASRDGGASWTDK